MSKEINAETLVLSDKIFKDLQINDSKLGIKADTDPYYHNLPDTLSREMVDGVKQYDGQFVVASVHAAGRAVIDAMKADKNVTLVTGSIPMAGSKSTQNNIEVSFERDRKFNVPGGEGKEAGEVIKPLYTVTKLHTAGVGTKTGQMGLVVKTLSELAAEAFAK